MSFYPQDDLIGVRPCMFCGGTSDRWFAYGHTCKKCFEELHEFKGTIEEKLQYMNTKKALEIKD